jgi:hypothetical protein
MMLGNWEGFYKYENEKIQKVVGYEETEFEIIIDDFDGRNFSGKVKDDEKTGGMKEIGIIAGEILNNKVIFEKYMPKNNIINTKGERRQLDKKHPKIYYSGTLSENKTEIIGTWKFKKKLGFLLGIIPIIYRPANGSWKMNLKIILLLISLNFFISCDCIQNVSGIILDAETNKPIDKVVIKKLGDNNVYNSDENGFFEIRKISGGLFKCPDMKIVITKEKYKTDTIEIKNGEDKLIKMIKL